MHKIPHLNDRKSALKRITDKIYDFVVTFYYRNSIGLRILVFWKKMVITILSAEVFSVGGLLMFYGHFPLNCVN